MILLIDNHDSFTYNIVQYLKEITTLEIRVLKTEEVNEKAIRLLNPHAILISPGPGHPKDYSTLISVIKAVYTEYSIFGVCLGFQILIHAFGGEIVKGEWPIHGHVYPIRHNGEGIFKDLPSPINVTRYHSLVATNEKIPETFEIIAYSKDHVPMAIKHKKFHIEAVQYHPESILSEYGHKQLENFMKEAGVKIESTYSV